MTSMKLLFPVALCLVFIGCSKGPMSAEEYANESLAISKTYFEVTREISDAPLPPKQAGLSRAEKYRIIGERVESDATKYAPLVERSKRLRPPPKFRAHHEALVALLEGTMLRNREWGAALKTGDRAAADAASKRLAQEMADSMGKLAEAIAALGDASELRSQQDLLLAEIRKM